MHTEMHTEMAFLLMKLNIVKPHIPVRDIWHQMLCSVAQIAHYVWTVDIRNYSRHAQIKEVGLESGSSLVAQV